VLLHIVCSWCERVIGVKEVENAALPVSHSICCDCRSKLEEEAEALFQSNPENNDSQERR
jgi:hypothetical protein